MTYLLDTNVISELVKPRRAASVLDWLEAHRTAELWISIITVGELRRGVAKLRHRNDHVQAEVLEGHITELEARFADYALPVTIEVARVWATLGLTQPISPADGLIAATAIVHGLTLITRNVRDFASTPVVVADPFVG